MYLLQPLLHKAIPAHSVLGLLLEPVAQLARRPCGLSGMETHAGDCRGRVIDCDGQHAHTPNGEVWYCTAVSKIRFVGA
jgi:hypothetical protein